MDINKDCMSLEDLLVLEKYAQSMSSKPQKYLMVNTKNNWKYLRDNKLCEHFTDEELNSGKNPFKRGWVAGCGVVDMYYDQYYENADNIAMMNRLNTKFELEFTGEFKTQI
jgi:hypothetical protein